MGKKKFNKSYLTKVYKGFRMGVQPKYKLNIKALEKCSVLTRLQHDLIKQRLEKCATIKKDKEENEKLVISATPDYIARLDALLDKPIQDAKVDKLGNPWERPKPLTEEDIKELNKKTIKEKNRKGKSRKDLQKENKEVKKDVDG